MDFDLTPDQEAMRDASKRLVERHVYAMYLPTRHLPSKVRVFIDFMISHIGEEPYWDR